MTTPFVLITTHRIKPGRLDELVVATREYNDFVEAQRAPRPGPRGLCRRGQGRDLARAGPPRRRVGRQPPAARGRAHQPRRRAQGRGDHRVRRQGPAVRRALERNAAAGATITVKPAAGLGSWGARPRRVRQQRARRRAAAAGGDGSRRRRDPARADRVVDLRTGRSPFVAATASTSWSAAGRRPRPGGDRRRPGAASSTSPPRRPMWRRSSGSPTVVLSVGLAPG